MHLSTTQGANPTSDSKVLGEYSWRLWWLNEASQCGLRSGNLMVKCGYDLPFLLLERYNYITVSISHNLVHHELQCLTSEHHDILGDPRRPGEWERELRVKLAALEDALGASSIKTSSKTVWNFCSLLVSF